jgi:hypothetical protein
VAVTFACTKATYKMAMMTLFRRCLPPTAMHHALALPVFVFVQIQHTTYTVVLFGSGSWQSTLVATAVGLIQKFALELPFVCGFVEDHWSTWAEDRLEQWWKLSVAHDSEPLPSADAEQTVETTQRRLSRQRRLSWLPRLSRESHLYLLAVDEVAGVLVPLTYAVIFTLVYLGKNGQWLGGIKSNMWHYRAPPNLEALLGNFKVEYRHLVRM